MKILCNWLVLMCAEFFAIAKMVLATVCALLAYGAVVFLCWLAYHAAKRLGVL